jgi:excisionase family DNA binding protein
MLGHSDRHVADILARPGLDDPDERRDATAWLRSYLTDNGGEAEAIDIFKAADKVGFSKDTLKRAKTRAGVASRKDGMDAGWMWVLDLDSDRPPFAPFALPSRRSTARLTPWPARRVHPSSTEGDPSMNSIRIGQPTTPPGDKALYRVPEVMVLLSLSRTVIYELIRSGRLRTVQQGRVRLIPAAAVAEYVALLEHESQTGAA